jgi:sRNA-binding regulator protein Hfq
MGTRSVIQLHPRYDMSLYSLRKEKIHVRIYMAAQLGGEINQSASR